MAYATGTAATAGAVLDAIQAFASAQGWTIDYAGADGGNQRLHIHKSGVFANFSSNYVPGSNLFGLQGSSGFTGSGSAWNAQTAPLGNIKSAPLSVSGSPVLPCTYHLFAQTSPDTLAGVFVGASGVVSYFMVGNLTKIGAYTGGDFYSAGDLISPVGAAQSPVNTSIDIKLTASFISGYGWGCIAATDTGNNQAPLMPVRLFENVSSAYKPRGVMPWVRVLSRNFANGDELVYGPDTWKVFLGANTSSSYMIALKK